MKKWLLFKLYILAIKIINIHANSDYFLCENRRYIPSTLKCNNVNDCGNWEDECGCPGFETLCQTFSCLSGNSTVRRRQVCDGIFDCTDLSDECLCERSNPESENTFQICNEIFNNDTECSDGLVSCRQVGKEIAVHPICLEVARICDGTIDCLDDLKDEMHCHQYREDIFQQPVKEIVSCQNKSLSGLKCDGIIDCPQGEDELACDGLYNYCTRDKKAYKTQYNLTRARNTTKNTETLFIDWRRSFDEVADCSNASDEWCETFIYCGVSYAVDVNSSPNNYSTEVTSRCFVKVEMSRPFSTPLLLLRQIFFRILMGVVGVTAVMGNIIVVAQTALTVISFKRSSSGKTRLKSPLDELSQSVLSISPNEKVESHTEPISKLRAANSLLIMSMCMGDLLMGVYLVSIVITHAVTTGEYWKFQYKILSSAFCSLLGCFAMMASQVSAYTILLITCLRLYTVKKPFSALNNLKLRYVVVLAAIIWIYAGIITCVSTMTYIPGVASYFVSAVTIPNHPQVDAKVLERTTVEKFVRKVALLSQTSVPGNEETTTTARLRIMSWKNLEKFTVDINPNFGPWLYYGYQGLYSVCVPPVVVGRNDQGWEFMFAVFVCNFAAYIFVMISYICIYKIATKRSRGIKKAIKTETINKSRMKRSSSFPPSRRTNLKAEWDAGFTNPFVSDITGLTASHFSINLPLSKQDSIPLNSTPQRKRGNFVSNAFIKRAKSDQSTTGQNNSVLSSLQIAQKADNSVIKMQKRISLLIVTDFFCWVPICTFTFLTVAFPHLNLRSEGWITLAIVMLVLNSALNPFLYSRWTRHLVKNCITKIAALARNKIQNVFTSSVAEQTYDDINLTNEADLNKNLSDDYFYHTYV